MAIDFSGVLLADNYATAFVPKLNEATKALACWLDPAYIAYAGTPYTGAKRLNGGVIQVYDGSAWVAAALSYAPLASPVFTGTPAAPTAVVDTASTQLATTAFVLGQAAAVAPSANGVASVGVSLRYARQDHVHPIDTSRAPLASPVFTGTPAAPTPGAGDASTRLATTAFVAGAVASCLPLSGGTLSGVLYGASNNPFRIVHDTGFISGYDAALTTRCGYLQFNTTSGYVSLVAEGSNYLRLVTQGSERMRLTDALAEIKCAARTAPVAVSYAAALALDASTSNFIKVGTLTGNVTSMSIGNAIEGQFLTVRFRQDSTGGRTIAVPAGAAITGTPNTAASKTSYLNLTWNATDARWEGAWTAIP